MTTNATQHGISDARTFAEEHPEDVAGALEPGQLGADESLISAMGVAATAKLFGVEADSDAFTAACGEYSAAFESELRSIAQKAAPQQCACGAALGEACSGTLGADAVTIEWMPDHLRASHEAARNSGSWLDNGALRLRVTPSCARHLEQHDGKWTHRI
jgi:hypothetical protein